MRHDQFSGRASWRRLLSTLSCGSAWSRVLGWIRGWVQAPHGRPGPAGEPTSRWAGRPAPAPDRCPSVAGFHLSHFDDRPPRAAVGDDEFLSGPLRVVRAEAAARAPGEAARVSRLPARVVRRARGSGSRHRAAAR
ncbi:hypothetical protein C7444_101389 [Sphaerotilus hippei]|uniref:Uncharacterized protein n=1 Tax=Sphaerotilus hippei TaxID=744406 RepID=A0A318HE38_9BURK|nr:hypothetical protein [Sphaerotilus hippei]PXW99559.1 hypothetical protein C7444_101389 [Sphaerotilus hippei]